MNLSMLHYFLVVAQELNITKASEKLFITQQSLSEQISRLEKEYNTKLFIRSPRLRLTPAGERMVIYAEKLLNAERQFKAEIAEIDNYDRLSIGIRNPYCQVILPQILPEFNKTHPSVHLHFIAGTSRVLAQMLRLKQLDFCIGSSRLLIHPDFYTIFLRDDPFVVVIPENLLKKHFHLTGDDIRAGAAPDFRELGAVPILALQDRNGVTRAAIDHLFDSYGVLTRNVFLESTSTDTNLWACAQGLGVTFIEKHVFESFTMHQNTKQPLYSFPFKTSGVNLHNVISYHRSRPLTPAAQDFIELVKRDLS